jgi:hypothetical protein
MTTEAQTARSPSFASSYAPPPSYTVQTNDASDSESEVAGQEPDTLRVDARDDGRVNVNCHAPLGRRLSRLLNTERLDLPAASNTAPPAYKPVVFPPSKLNIVIQVAGSRGDVQPFIALGTALQRG